MLRLDWNALRPGDRVLVHQHVGGNDRLVAGVVTAVEPTAGSNDIAVRLSHSGRTETVHPQRLQVHHDPIEVDGSCWRCATPRAVPQVAKRRGG